MTVRSSSRGLRRSSAFSLLEIIAVLALFGLIAGLLLSGGSRMLDSVSPDDVEQTAITAVAAARHEAVLNGQIVELNYDETTRMLKTGTAAVELTGEDQIRLLPPVRTSAMLVGGRLVENAITRVRFYPDGTCDPFRLEVVHERTSRYIAIDPWTCTPLADPDADKPK